jgi:REP element-mobilizing transposase RayT
MLDHVHMGIAIPPKHPVASVIGSLKGKSAIAIARLSGKERDFTGDSGLEVTPYRPSCSNWSRSVSTSVSRRPRMATTEASEVKK